MGMLRRVQRRKQFGVVVAGSYCCADVGTVRPDVTCLVCSAIQLPLHLPFVHISSRFIPESPRFLVAQGRVSIIFFTRPVQGWN